MELQHYIYIADFLYRRTSGPEYYTHISTSDRRPNCIWQEPTALEKGGSLLCQHIHNWTEIIIVLAPTYVLYISIVRASDNTVDKWFIFAPHTVLVIDLKKCIAKNQTIWKVIEHYRAFCI